jgi:cytochrome c oxidase assembly factor 1
MERRADRELPSIKPPHPWLKTLPIFAVIIAAATLGIFNYQKSSSSVVSSTLFALRTHPRAREALGEQIYFKHKFPWIWGEMNQLHGRINIRYSVKGTKDSGMMTFRSMRKRRDGKVSLFSSFFFSCLHHSTGSHS